MLDTETITQQIIRTRQRLTNKINRFNFLNTGGMALADHRGETIRAHLEALESLQELNYFEKLAGLELTEPDIIPKNRYVEATNE